MTGDQTDRRRILTDHFDKLFAEMKRRLAAVEAGCQPGVEAHHLKRCRELDRLLAEIYAAFKHDGPLQ